MEQEINPYIERLLAFVKELLGSAQGYMDPYLPEVSWAAYAAFAVYVLVLLGGGFMAILCRNLVRAMLGLILTFLGVAGMYLLLAAPFLAFMQLLIYVGAVCVLIFFAIMLTHNTADGEEAHWPTLYSVAYAGLAFIAPLAVAGPLIVMHAGKIAVKVPVDTGTEKLGEGLLSSYVLSFELISIILLVSMAGAVYLAFRGFGPGRREKH
jgi:NADH-quinone oxidoreductase subunit J